MEDNVAKRLLGVLTEKGWAAWRTCNAKYADPTLNKHKLTEPLELEHLVRNAGGARAVLTIPAGANLMQASKSVRKGTRAAATVRGTGATTLVLFDWVESPASPALAQLQSDGRLWYDGPSEPIIRLIS